MTKKEGPPIYTAFLTAKEHYIKQDFQKAYDNFDKVFRFIEPTYHLGSSFLQPSSTYGISKELLKENPITDDQFTEMKSALIFLAHLLFMSLNIHSLKVLEENKKNMEIMNFAKAMLDTYMKEFPMSGEAKHVYALIMCHLFDKSIDEHRYDMAESFIKQGLAQCPENPMIYYKLGVLYQQVNKSDEAILNLKTSLCLLNMIPLEKRTKEHVRITRAICNSIGCVYYSLQDKLATKTWWTMGLELNPNDPDMNNQMGVFYTDLRQTEKAMYHYKQALRHVMERDINNDYQGLYSTIYMNMGLAYSYNCDLEKAVWSYHMSIKHNPKNHLAFQNKLLELNYLAHMFTDTKYISREHFKLNDIFPKVVMKYENPNYIKKESPKNIGFVSGDFLHHPVSYFVNQVIKGLGDRGYNVNCYSQKIFPNIEMYFPDFKNVKFITIRGKSAQEVCDMVKNDDIDILFDLSAQTGDNRLDAFALKPAPITCTYIGYPNSSGLKNMDFRITDSVADFVNKQQCPSYMKRDFEKVFKGNSHDSSLDVQEYYTETLLRTKRQFLLYKSPVDTDSLPLVQELPCKKNGYITFVSFNRNNKVNPLVIEAWNKILLGAPTAIFKIKMRELFTPSILTRFLEQFDESVRSRIKVMDYKKSYMEHLPDYNEADIMLDTFKYSGTTTSAESLMMGTPIITNFDPVVKYHSQNVTSSLEYYCDHDFLKSCICVGTDEYVKRAIELANDLSKMTFTKNEIRHVFMNSMNPELFMDDFTTLLNKMYEKV